MAMSVSLRKKLIAGTFGAVAIATAMITGSSGNNGLEGVRYEPYYDVAGVLSVCYGHTGKDIMLGKIYTPEECKALLNKDLSQTARQIDPYIKVKIPASTHAALYSFAYNVGSRNFETSTLLYQLNKGNITEACQELKRWVYAGGNVVKGLMNRREIETEVCEWGDK